MKSEQLKIVWICYYTNSHVQSRIPVKKKQKEMAPWIQNTIEGFRKHKNVELHIISPHKYISRLSSFSEENIHYYFFPMGVPFFHRSWPNFFPWDVWTKFRSNRRYIKNLIGKIQPDLINLIGSDRKNIAISLFDIQNIPVFVSIQGFLSLSPSRESIGKKFGVSIEKKVFGTQKYFGIRANYMTDYIKQFNNSAEFYWNEFPLKLDDAVKSEKKVYDLIYFARIVKAKGIEDAVHAFRLVVDKKKEAKMAIIGGGARQYVDEIKGLISELKLEDNITFFGFLSTQEDVYKVLAQSRVSILPTYNEIISGTILESIRYKVPVVAYSVGGIPDLNMGKQRVLLCEKGNINCLAENVISLLNQKALSDRLVDAAYEYFLDRFNYKKIINDMINIYRSILSRENNLTDKQ